MSTIRQDLGGEIDPHKGKDALYFNSEDYYKGYVSCLKSLGEKDPEDYYQLGFLCNVGAYVVELFS